MSEEQENNATGLDGEFPWGLPSADGEWLEMPANPEGDETPEK